jgi:hypothetical protein
MESAPTLFADAVADEDHSDSKTAVTRRIAQLRASTRNHNVTLTDIDAFSRQCAYRIVVLSVNANGVTRTQFGRGTAARTAVLILVGGHYRVATPYDTAINGANTLGPDTTEDAIEFARSHAVAWASSGASAPMFPASYAPAATAPAPAPAMQPTASDAAPAASHPSAKPSALADAGATARAHDSARSEAKQWRVQTGRLQYVEKLVDARTAVVTCSPPATDIIVVEQRLQAIGVTLSQFARRWTIAPGGSLHVEAATPALFTALIETATGVRRVTRTTGLIDIVPFKPPGQLPDAKALAKAPAKPAVKPKPKAAPASQPPTDQRHSPRGRARSRGGRKGRGGGQQRRVQSPARDSHSPSANTGDAATLRAVRELLHEQMRHVHELLAQPQRQPLAQRAFSPQPRVRRPEPTRDRPDSTEADEFEAFKRFEAFKALKRSEPPKPTGAATKRDRSRHRSDGQEEGDDAHSDDDTAHAHGTPHDS